MLIGFFATLAGYLFALVSWFQITENTCIVPPKDYSGGGGMRNETSLWPMGVRCTWRASGSPDKIVYEPGWWLTMSILAVGVGLMLISLTVAQRMRIRGHTGWAYGLLTLCAPPLGVLLAATARDSDPDTSRPVAVGIGQIVPTTIVWIVGLLVSGVCYALIGAALYFTVVGPCYFPPGTDPVLEPRPSIFPIGRNCAYASLDSGTVTRTFEPGWWPTLVLICSAALLAWVSICVARSIRSRGARGWIYGIATFLAPPLGLLLAVSATRRLSAGENSSATVAS